MFELFQRTINNSARSVFCKMQVDLLPYFSVSRTHHQFRLSSMIKWSSYSCLPDTCRRCGPKNLLSIRPSCMSSALKERKMWAWFYFFLWSQCLSLFALTILKTLPSMPGDFLIDPWTVSSSLYAHPFKYPYNESILQEAV